MHQQNSKTMVNTTDQWNNDIQDEAPISMCMMSDSDFERDDEPTEDTNED